MTNHEKKREKKHVHIEDKNQLQEKYIELQILKQQVSSLIEQKHAIDERENELNVTLAALRKLDTVNKGNEMWSSIGSGAFVRSDIKDIEKVLVAIGAGLVVKESVPKSIEILELRLHEFSDINNEVVQQINTLVSRMSKLETELQKIAGKEE
ncbi:MAG TPA: prefoldin subunit alpha [Candidatus Aenigmarchaeota archaeon]|nr:prefoldin subunit alpha [Candidatus Aenigmarchaeota archaeon]